MATASSRKPVWIVLTATLVFHAMLVSFQANHRLQTAFMRSWMLNLQAPFEQLADRGIHGVGSIWSGYFALVGLHRENLRLQDQIDHMKIALQKADEDVQEAKRLRSLTGVSEAGVGKTVVARVIGRDPTLQHLTITIDKGRAQGVKPDSAVLTPDGIVGRVIYSSNFYSVVQLILDGQSSVGALVQTSRRQAILSGTGGSELDLDYIDDDNDIKEGDKFVTSGQDRIYPKGLPVGIISSVGPRHGLFKAVKVRPLADFGKLEEVLCVIDAPHTILPEVEGPPWQP